MNKLSNYLITLAISAGSAGFAGSAVAADHNDADRGHNSGLPSIVLGMQRDISTNIDNIADNFSQIQSNRADIAENSDRIDTLEAGSGPGGGEIAVNCTADANAFMGNIIQDNTTYILTGMCNGPIWIENHRNVTITGDGDGDKDDGVMLPADLVANPFGAIGAWNSQIVKLENLTVSAANYVTQTYSFGSNVSSLIAGDQSFIEVSDVDFVGGDYSVSIYNESQLNVNEGVSILDFNSAGLSAYNGSLIRTNHVTTVTGLIGGSNQTYTYAILAENNSVVEVKGGGSFSGASGVPFDEYPNAVWSGDNSTIRFGVGANPTVVHGSIESAYSSMVRISGNLTLNGALAAYHRGYIRAVDIIQSNGEVYAGDAASLRIESSELSPSSTNFPCCGMEAYRQGNMRLNKTKVNVLGDDHTIYVSGFSVLDIRGEGSDLGGADISCHDANQIRIRAGVMNVGNVTCFGPPPPP